MGQATVRQLREELGAEVGAVQQVFPASDPVGDAGVSVQRFFVCRLRHPDPAQRCGPEYLEAGRGGYDLDRVVPGADGSPRVDLKPAAVKAFLEANRVALVDAVSPTRR